MRIDGRDVRLSLLADGLGPDIGSFSSSAVAALARLCDVKKGRLVGDAEARASKRKGVPVRTFKASADLAEAATPHGLVLAFENDTLDDDAFIIVGRDGTTRSEASTHGIDVQREHAQRLGGHTSSGAR